MATLEDLQADIRETADALRDDIEYDEACDAGYNGTLASFRRDKAAELRARFAEPSFDVFTDSDDLPF